MAKQKVQYTKKYYNIEGHSKELMVVSKYQDGGCVSLYAGGSISVNSLSEPDTLSGTEHKATKAEYQKFAIEQLTFIAKKAGIKATFKI